MKKSLLMVIIMIVCVLSFSACNQDNTPPVDNTCQHSFGDWTMIKQATCIEKGELVRVCSKCSAKEKTTVSKTDVHTEVVDAAVSPTCEATGLTEGKHCSCCDAVIIEQTIIEAPGHEFTNYVSDNNAKCGVDGTKTATCNRDGCNGTDTRTDEGSALEHEFTNYVSDNNATYEKDGTKTATCNHEGCLVTDTVLAENTRMMEKIIILDASASMRTECDGTTRFERAVWQILEFSDDFFQENGTISLILADNTPELIAERSSAAERETFFSTLNALLENDKCSYGSADIKSAMALAETILKQNANAEILLYTGTNYQTDSNVKIINVSENGEWNAAILDANTTVIENYYMLEVDLACYAKSEVIQLNVDVFGANDEWFTLQYHIMCPQNQEIKVVFINEDLYSETTFDQENTVYFLLSKDEKFYSFEYISISIDEQDSFIYDNYFYLYGEHEQVVETQYASTNPNILISGALYSLQDSWDISITETKNAPATEGYDFYIFENKSLTAFPADGVVFLINPSASSLGFSLGETVTGNFTLTFDGTHPITSTISSTGATISSYTKISSYDSSFTPVIWCGNDPVCLVKNTPTEKIVVLTFDLGDSDLATTSLPLLMHNIFDYFFPKTIEKDVFNVGEEVEINSTNESVNLSWYETEIEYTQFPSTFIPNVPGTYTVTQTLISGTPYIKNFFVRIPSVESNISRTENLPQPNQVIVSVTVQEDEECRIVKIEQKNNRIEVGKTTALKVFINSTFEGAATLTLYYNGEAVKTKEIDLIKGSQMVEIEYIFSTYGLHEFAFDIVKNDGSLLTKNSTFYADFFVESLENILIIERNSNESKALVEILSENENYEITVLNILKDYIPLTIEELSVYDQVILVNIANEDMPQDFDKILRSFVYDMGGSLLTVGGNKENGEANTYKREDMFGSLYQEMLPVEAIDYTPPVGVVFIIDASGSMMQTDYSGNTYFDWAKESLFAGLDALTERDFVGIVLLNDSASVVLPMTPRTERGKILSAIDSLEATGGATIFSSAIKQAGMLLLTCNNLAKRHIIMITDGAPAEKSEEYQTIIENSHKYGITFSIIGIGLNDYNNAELELRHAVELGGGRLYATQEMEILPMLMRDELSTPEIKDVNYESFSVALNPEYKEIFNIPIENLPILEWFYGTKLKGGATEILTGIYDVPIYAQWDYGKGTVGSFMCDLNGTFSQELIYSADGNFLLNKIISGAFSMSNVKIDEILMGENAPTESAAFKASWFIGGTLELILEDENGLNVQSMVLYEEADLETELEFLVSKTGNYTLKYIQKDAAGDIISTGELLISLST